MAPRRRHLRPRERLRPGHWGYALSREDCAKGGRKSAEKRRERADRHKRVLRAHHQRRNRAHNLKAWRRERDANGQFLPSRRSSSTVRATEETKAPDPPSTSPMIGAYRPPPVYGLAQCDDCGWAGKEYNLVKHARMKHASPNSPWHPKNAARRSAEVRRARLEARKRYEEETRAELARMASISKDPSDSCPGEAPTGGVSAG